MAHFSDEVSEQCEICRALDKAPLVPISGTSAASGFSGKVQVHLLSLGDAIALLALDVCSMYSFLIPVRFKDPHKARGFSRSSLIAVLGRPKCIPTDEGGL